MRCVRNADWISCYRHHGPYSHERRKTLHPEILRTCSQAYHEAVAILYGSNTFFLGTYTTEFQDRSHMLMCALDRSSRLQAHLLRLLPHQHRHPQRPPHPHHSRPLHSPGNAHPNLPQSVVRKLGVGLSLPQNHRRVLLDSTRRPQTTNHKYPASTNTVPYSYESTASIGESLACNCERNTCYNTSTCCSSNATTRFWSPKREFGTCAGAGPCTSR